MRNTLVGIAAAAVLSAAAGSATPVAAGDGPGPASLEDFRLCDGYGAPSPRGDGMILQASGGAMLATYPDEAHGNTLRSLVAFGADGIGSCDRALADPTLSAEQWQRRVSLLMARGAHRMASGDLAGAEADLGLAEQAAKDPADPFYQRSLALQIGLVKAFLLRQRGDQAGAERAALAIWEQRPYDRETTRSAFIVIGPGGDAALRQRLMERLASLDPDLLSNLFQQAYDQGRFADATALFETLAPPPDGKDDFAPYTFLLPVNVPETLHWRQTREENAVLRAGEAAYAYAATGQGDKAKAVLKAAADRLASVTAPPKVSGRPLSEKNAALIPPANEQLAANIGKRLASWTRLVELRLGDQTAAADEPLPPTRASLDLIDVLGGPQLLARRATVQTQVEKALRLGPKEDASLERLFATLPDAASAQNRPYYHKAEAVKPKYLFRDDTPGTTGIVYYGYDPVSASMVAEETLWEAATLAKAAGKGGFVIIDRFDNEDSSQPNVYGRPSGPSHHTGFTTKLLVKFVDPAAAPPEFARLGWRIFDVEAVYQALNPIYGPRPKS